MEGAVDTGTATAAPAKRGATWRRVERDWIDCDAYKSLPASAQALYMHLVVVAHPRWGLGLSSRELAARTGRDERTTRRLVQVLEEAELIRVERTRGGAHKATNRYWSLPPTSAAGHRPGLDRIRRRKIAAVAPADATSTDTSSTPTSTGTSSAVGATSVDQFSAATMPSSTALSADAMARLVAQVADDRHLTVEQAREELDGYGAGSLGQLAAYYGLDDAATASVAPPPEDPEALAKAIVDNYLRAWDLTARVPYKRELALARQVVAHAGSQAWELYRNANRRLAALVAKWKRDATRPYTFLYLLPHLAVEKALPPPQPDEPPN